MNNPNLDSEESFKKFVNKLCCNGCKHFVNNKCTKKNAKAHEIDKAWTIQASLNDYLQTRKESDREFIENINDYYICMAFESKVKIETA